MKIKFYKIEGYMFFSILLFISDLIKKNPSTTNDVNRIATDYVGERRLTVKPKTLDENYIFKMLNCVGNVIFNKNEKMYFARPDDTLPVLVYFNSVLDKAMTNYKTWCSIVLDNITKYEHLSHKDRMFIFKNKEIFKKYLEKNFSNYEKYLAMFYRQKQRYIVKIKRGDSK